MRGIGRRRVHPQPLERLWPPRTALPTLDHMSDSPRPILGLSGAEAARILGVHELSVVRLVRQGVLHKPVKRQQSALDRAEVEQPPFSGGLPVTPTGRTAARPLRYSASPRAESTSLSTKGSCRRCVAGGGGSSDAISSKSLRTLARRGHCTRRCRRAQSERVQRRS